MLHFNIILNRNESVCFVYVVIIQEFALSPKNVLFSDDSGTSQLVQVRENKSKT